MNVKGQAQGQVLGFVLAAGFGTRLRPFTENTPKPLMPFFMVPIIEYGLFRFHKVGVHQLSVNAHHQANRLESWKKIQPFSDMNIHLSIEPEILGTGGGVLKIKDWFFTKKGENLLIYNGDIISDIDLKEAMDFHKDQNALATMVLLEKPFPGKTPLYCSYNHLISIGGEGPKKELTKHSFTGVHIISKRFFEFINTSNIIDAYHLALQKKEKICSYFHKGYWQDLGDPTSYFEAHRRVMEDYEHLSNSLGLKNLLSLKGKTIDFASSSKTPYLHSGDSIISKNATIGPNVFLGEGVRVGENAHLLNTVVDQGAIISDGEQVMNKVLIGDHSVPIQKS